MHGVWSMEVPGGFPRVTAPPVEVDHAALRRLPRETELPRVREWEVRRGVRAPPVRAGREQPV
eukprot:8079222-Pyramimonas_sp.AAC.1